MSDSPAPRIEALGNDRFRVHTDGRSRVAYAVREGADTWVWLDGVAYVVSEHAEGRLRSSAGHDAELSAPMPATVRSVAVTVGQTVEMGQVLVVLEAMKMELAIKAPRAGTVSGVHCREGELVQPGVALVDLSQ